MEEKVHRGVSGAMAVSNRNIGHISIDVKIDLNTEQISNMPPEAMISLFEATEKMLRAQVAIRAAEQILERYRKEMQAKLDDLEARLTSPKQ